MRYTRNNFDMICKRILGEDLFKSLEIYGPAKVLDITIIRVWGDMVKLKDGEEAILRQAYYGLKTPGYFRFEKED